jgi:hypothetical protein
MQWHVRFVPLAAVSSCSELSYETGQWSIRGLRPRRPRAARPACRISAHVGCVATTFFSRQSYFTGIRTGASLSLSKTTKNLAGIVLLAL